MNKLAFAFLVCFVGAVYATHSDCGSELGTVVSLDIVGCDDKEEKCILRRNTNATVSVTFTLKDDVEKLKAVVHGKVLGVEVPFELPNSDACTNSGLACPLKSGETYTYTATLPVLKKYPRVSVEVKWELQNEAKKDAFCLTIPSKIQ